jgi:hypothetical protein
VKAGCILTMAMATLALALAGCGDFLTLDARAPNACVTINGLHVPGLNEIPTNYFFPPSPTVTTHQSIDVPFDATVLPQGSAYSVKLVSFKLESAGTQTMEFVESAKLTANASGKSLVVATFTRTSAVPTKSIETAPDPAPDVTAYIVNGVLHLEGDLTGTAPAQGFAAAATVCFDVATTIGAK